MAKFSFRLATLLRLREATRDEHRNALANVLRDDALLATRAQQLTAEMSRLRASTGCEVRPGLLNVDRLRDAQRYESQLRAEEQSIAVERAALAEVIEQRRLELVAADTEVRTLEKLREAGLSRHQQEQQLDETKQLDETATLRAAERRA